MGYAVFVECIYNQSKKAKKKKRNTPTNFSTNYRREMKLVPINMNDCLLQFNALKFVSGVSQYGTGSVSNFNFLNVKPQI